MGIMIINRRLFIQKICAFIGAFFIKPTLTWLDKKTYTGNTPVSKSDFGREFLWGAAGAAFQTEGACDTDGRSPSIWDTFSLKPHKIKNHENARTASDFYHRYAEDISFLRKMNFNAFRFSLSWSRLIPGGTGAGNQKGIDFYNQIIDSCLEKNITPWIVLYHWDLPQILEDKGGWTNRDITGWFEKYSSSASQLFGDRVKHWIVLNEPMAFTSFGYLLGIHAPGKRGLKNFLPAVHHAALCQSIGAAVIKDRVNDSQVGTAFSCSPVDPVDDQPKNIKAAERIDAALNRLFIEPSLGLGYPTETLPVLKNIEKYYVSGDENLLTGNFDFIGLQYYFRIVGRSSIIPPLYAKQVEPDKRNGPINYMKLEVYPEGILRMLEKFSSYTDIKKFYVTESGVCYDDLIKVDGSIADVQRIEYFKSTLNYISQAKKKGIPVEGYFVWSLTDNFEWREGYSPRFGLLYVDYPTQKRIMKDSGKWFGEFLGNP